LFAAKSVVCTTHTGHLTSHMGSHMTAINITSGLWTVLM